MSPPLHQRSASRDRRIAYLAGAAAAIALWPLDAGLVGHWPIETLLVRIAWAAALLFCCFVGSRGGSRLLDLTGGAASIGSSIAIVFLAAATGGTASAYFTIAGFLPLLFAQVEPERSLPTWAGAATALCCNTLLLVLEGKSALTIAGWITWLVFIAWWAIFWQQRLAARYRAEREAQQREAELERARLRAQEELAAADRRTAQAERLALVGRISAGIAHEINNPLAYVRSNLELLAALGEERRDRPLHEMASDSLQGVEQIGHIIADLRGLAREPKVALEDVDPSRAIDEAMRLATIPLRRVQHVELQVENDLPLLRCQRSRLVQVLVNLLANAAEAAEGAPASRVRLAACVEHGNLVLTVDDNGPGIAAEHFDRIFDPFFSTKEGSGMGVGLPLSRDFALGLGGGLEATRSDLGGARFLLMLPIERAAAAA